MKRRPLLFLGLATGTGALRAAPAPGASGALRVGADLCLVESGLAPALVRAFELDTGLAVVTTGAPALALLEALAAGELDAALLNVPDAESSRLREGLVYDRQAIANGDFVLVGPGGRGAAGMAAAALARLFDPAAGPSSGLVFLTANDGSGAHLAEQALWRSARIAPQATWYRNARNAADLVGEARAAGACAVVERGAWAARGGRPLAILGAGDPVLVEQVHVMRSFRSPHAAGKLFVGWIAGSRGRAVALHRAGYRAATA
jgi:tungstate transport system substrate-binding protein